MAESVYRNSEGYFDPTAGEAVAKIVRAEKRAAEVFRPLVYICAPYAGDTEQNIKRAAAFAKHAYRCEYLPVTSHLLFSFLDDSKEADRNAALRMGLVLMDRCQEVWVLGENISDGMRVEIERAERRRQPVRYFTDDFREVEHESA